MPFPACGLKLLMPSGIAPDHGCIQSISSSLGVQNAWSAFLNLPSPLVPQPALPPSFLNLHAPLPADVQDADLLEAFLNLPVPSPPPPTLFSTCPSFPPRPSPF